MSESIQLHNKLLLTGTGMSADSSLSSGLKHRTFLQCAHVYRHLSHYYLPYHTDLYMTLSVSLSSCSLVYLAWSIAVAVSLSKVSYMTSLWTDTCTVSSHMPLLFYLPSCTRQCGERNELLILNNVSNFSGGVIAKWHCLWELMEEGS